MSAADKDTFAEEGDGMEEQEDSADDDEGVDMEEEEGADGETKVYVPGIEPLQPGERLEMDQSAYRMYHECQTGAPCLSFDILKDNNGDGREDFPLSMLLCAGTQADKAMANRLLIMRMHNLHGTEKAKKEEDEESSEESSEEEDEDEGASKKPLMELAMMPHFGAINRVRVTRRSEQTLAAVWSEKGQVEIFDLRPQLEAVHSSAAMKTFMQQQKEATALFSFSGHMTEGYAIDWSPLVPGRLVSGDCKKNIHMWEPQEGGASWRIDQRPFSSHSKSVEDLQWSPTEATVFASCSVDCSIRVWDIRAPPNSMLAANEAHASDINVISWNRTEPFLLSGGDDGLLKVWDLRQFKTGRPVATFKQHGAPITSVEWSPADPGVFAASGADDVVSQWDLSVESCDTKVQSCDTKVQDLHGLPPQLLFLHQGQSDIKEIHWHPQVPGVLVSTALSGFNVFRTISV
ncbi:glutamate-rich WD repeat-containing protein 1 [Entelurus aequoreus]|uniref:glutamate-rich WD repeat-containing protein 1 n=1 Tax=Entelurus aequoreus TaxID=161455 RepID=UPI002B1E0438|nr:glutamate-rich WD repeat-containing protein 1 [Entelurus aequoreus]XP_061918496.1 glutamate-rich WD repeat-containing protein 1 [Entelurus aequoreus]XP_061918497.1 glutamate-rich WD repeat-containing protein 1 [Entelurus aequoreus]